MLSSREPSSAPVTVHSIIGLSQIGIDSIRLMKLRLIVGVGAALVCGALHVHASPLDDARRDFTAHKPIPGTPDLSKPVFIEKGALACATPTVFASGAYALAMRGVKDAAGILRQNCVLVGSRRPVKLLVPQNGNVYVLAHIGRYIQFIAPSLQESDASMTVGWVLLADLVGSPTAPIESKASRTKEESQRETSGATGLTRRVIVPTRFGTLRNDGADGRLTFNGVLVRPDTYVQVSSYVIGVYELREADAVLIAQDSGNVCPGNFSYITTSADGVQVSPRFGTCYDEDVKPVQVGESIAFSMTNVGKKGSTPFVYEHGVVFQNGKPVK